MNPRDTNICPPIERKKYLYLFRQVCFKFNNFNLSLLNLHLVLESFDREVKIHFNRSMQLEEK